MKGIDHPESAVRALLPRLTLIALGVLAGASLVEVGLRLARWQGAAADLRGLHEAELEQPWIYRLRPGVELRVRATGAVGYRINEDGFRDRRYERARPPDAFRILVLGDSVTFGYGVDEEDGYSALLEARLARRAGGPSIEVLNFGVGGYNAYNEAAFFDGVGAAYQPDLVLVQFCINDLNDPRLHFDAQTRFALEAIPAAAFPDPSQRRVALGAGSPLAFCADRFRVCDLLERAFFADRADARALALAMAPHAGLGEGPERAWLRAQYASIRDRATAFGARFAVVAFPHEQQVAGSASDQIQRDLIALGREGGWATLDLLPAFREAVRREEPLFLDLWHPNALGHRIAAAELERQLLQLDLVPH